MKIFVSYSRRDADFAQQINEYFKDSEHNIFTDIKNIQVGTVWTSAIETNISNCDIFVVIVTDPALRSTEVEKEILQAQKENKKIIPCFYRNIKKDKIKWGLERIHGVEFDDKYELARNIASEIANMSKEGIVISKVPEKINTLINNGNILFDQAKYPEAVEWYDKVLRLDPNNESVRHKRFQAIQHLPKSSFKVYSNVKIRAKTLTEELISYLQQKNFKVISNPDYKNNTYLINANKLRKLDVFNFNIKIRDHLSNLEIVLLSDVLEHKHLGTGPISFHSLSSAMSVASMNPVGLAIPLIQLYANHKLKKEKNEIWKFIEQKILVA